MATPAEIVPTPPVLPKVTFRAMTNTERQRRFRARNPGYYGRLHRKRNARIDASLAAKAEAKAKLQTEAPTTSAKPQLCLPAPDPEKFRLLDELKALQVDRERAALAE